MAGNIKVNSVQLGDSATATQNFVWQTNVDGTAKLARGNVGATTQDILTVDAAGRIGLVVMTTYANDAAAAAGGVAIGQLYRNGSAVQVRVA